jgi:hypothetical protein
VLLEALKKLDYGVEEELRVGGLASGTSQNSPSAVSG